jgi:hypothetical protein
MYVLNHVNFQYVFNKTFFTQSKPINIQTRTTYFHQQETEKQMNAQGDNSITTHIQTKRCNAILKLHNTEVILPHISLNIYHIESRDSSVGSAGLWAGQSEF